MTAASPAIVVTGVRKAYGRGGGAVQALSDVSFEVQRGTIAGILGPNGAGKSTLIHVVLGLVSPDGGSVELFGSPAGDPHAREGVGFLPEEVSYEAGLRIREILGVHAGLAGAPARGAAADALRLVGLEIPLRRRISRCSLGQARRVALAGALLGNPRLLVLDEPTAGMDLPSKDRLFGFLRDFRARGGTAVISSHVLSELEAVCDSFVIMRGGRVVRVGGLDGLRSTAHVRIVVEGLSEVQLSAALGDGWLVRAGDRSVIAETMLAEDALGVSVARVEQAGGRVRAAERGQSLEDVYRDEALS